MTLSTREIEERLVDCLRASNEGDSALYRQLLRLLAEGQAVTIERVVEALATDYSASGLSALEGAPVMRSDQRGGVVHDYGFGENELNSTAVGEASHRKSGVQVGELQGPSYEEVRTRLGKLKKIEYDDEGRIVAAGLSLRQTPHRFLCNGQELFAWCAFDTLAYPGVLGVSALVESRCPVSGRVVSLTVTPTSIGSFELSSLYVSLVLPDKDTVCHDIRGAFCNHVHYLSSRSAARHWQYENAGTLILPVVEMYKIAGRVAQQVYTIGD